MCLNQLTLYAYPALHSQTLQIVTQMNYINKMRGGKNGPGPPFDKVLAAAEDLTSLDFW